MDSKKRRSNIRGGARMDEVQLEVFARRMENYRRANKISQAKCAYLCGVTLQTWNQIEKRNQSPSLITESKIEALIGRDIVREIEQEED